MEIHELHSDQTHLVEQALWIYEASFPVEERDANEALLATLQWREQGAGSADETFHFQVALEGHDVLGIAIFSYYQPAQMGFIPYFAIHPQRRGGGLGTHFYQHIIAATAADARLCGEKAPLGVSFEVERPELARNHAEAELRRRRIGFYQRGGALELPQLNLVAPPLGPDLPEMAYTILLHPLAGWIAPPGRAEIEAVVKTVLGHGYNLPPDSPYYQRALASIDID